MTLNSSLLVAAELGYVQEVNRLLDQGADVNARNVSGSSVLNEACVQGSTPIVGLLLRRDADPNIADQDLRTPLHRCAFHGWDQCIRLLLDYGADPQKQDARLKTPVDVACDSITKQIMNDYPKDQTDRLLKMWAEKHKAVQEKQEEAEENARKAEQERQKNAAEEEENKENVSSHAIAAAEEGKGATAEEMKGRATAISEILQNTGVNEEESSVVASMLDVDKEKNEEIPAEKEEIPPPPFRSTSGYPDVYMTDAADAHLNGRYVEVVRNEHCVELVKEGNKQCQIFWASYTREWRMVCANFKGGNTLFRNPEKLGLNAVGSVGNGDFGSHEAAPSARGDACWVAVQQGEAELSPFGEAVAPPFRSLRQSLRVGPFSNHQAPDSHLFLPCDEAFLKSFSNCESLLAG
eukprot:GEMP01015244.1.p1 GENE.GEMP01015244.1~~GEMP01015244.1.p1  ORF type:complete len:427 (+),score=89.78 GEMP01015244.1:59-1282(+)